MEKRPEIYNEVMSTLTAVSSIHLTKKLSLLHHPNLVHSLSTTFSSQWDLKATHAQLLVTGLLFSDKFTIARLLAAAAFSPSASDLLHARYIFMELTDPTRFMYNTMIRAFSQTQEFSSQSVRYYTQMRRNGISPDRLTFPFLVRSVSLLPNERVGKGVHCDVVRFGVARDLYVVNNLISMYSGFGDLGSARKVFDQSVDIADVVSWTAIVTGYVNAGELGLAYWYFDRMPERNLVSWNSMVGGFAREGRKVEARLLFDTMPKRDVASWSSLMSGYSQSGLCKEALSIFKEMIGAGILPNESALVSAVSACAQLRALEQGEWINSYIKDVCRIELDVTLGSALIDMYGKCGDIGKAYKIFKEMRTKNVYSWNSMITGMAMNGSGRQALTLFWKMKMAGVKPNAITFIGLLTACSHAGLVDEGQQFFNLMTRVYRIRPNQEHYGCVVDLLGRAGLIEEAIDFTEKMPVKLHPGLLGALVGACRIHGDVQLGEELGKRLIEMEPQKSGRYALLYNIYAAARRWNDAAMVSKLVKDRRVVKEPGSSTVKE